MPSELKVCLITSDVAVATFRHVLFAHFRRATLESSAVALRAAMGSLGQGPKSVAFFGVIEVESDPPDQATRKAFTRFFEDMNPRLSCAVICYRGEGFRGAMVRTIVSGIMDLMPRFRFAFPRHVVGTLEEAATSVLRYSPGLDTAALLGAFRELAATHPGPPGAAAR